MKIKITADSTCDLSAELLQKWDITLMPMHILMGEDSYLDGVTIHPAGVFTYVNGGGKMPKSAAANLVEYAEFFGNYTGDYDAVIHISVSSKLSSCYQNAKLAAEDFANVYVVDSGTAAIGTGILAEYALTCIDRGMDAAALVRELTEKREDVCVLALVDTLEYLKRGGRISKTTALAGGLLNIKPVLTIEKGEILLIGKARGSRQGNNLLVEKIRACGGIDFQLPILLGYTGLTDVFLKKYVEDSRALWENGVDGLESTLIGGVIGTHAGPGAIAVAFFRRG